VRKSYTSGSITLNLRLRTDLNYNFHHNSREGEKRVTRANDVLDYSYERESVLQDRRPDHKVCKRLHDVALHLRDCALPLLGKCVRERLDLSLVNADLTRALGR
jgi:hypothetical protein